MEISARVEGEYAVSARIKGRAAAAAIAFAGVVGAGMALAGPAGAAVTAIQVDSSNLFGSLDQRYGAGCAYGIIADVDTEAPVEFKVNGQSVLGGTKEPDGGKAVYNWVPVAPGEYTITATQSGVSKSVGPLTVGVGVYTGSSCIVLY
ncbi:hypothetical protein GORHZ_152_00040 [Gordonia rhizosphera NBRC 16068]|uniref:Uncharacterized protein n=2 Tax=Gordonia rhizosphera TaxID=83341 RepID=K6V6P9_9ACTN|nr:hypothetical protein GORHZ_152_00040 [Gordonia rhizosphera NBRC 16068]